MQDLFARVFSGAPLAGKLSSEDEEIFRRHMRLSSYKESRLLMVGAARCDEVLMVLQGAIRVYKMSEEGREVTLYRLSPGDTCLMTVSCLAGVEGLEANVEIEAGSEVVSMPAGVFQSMLDKNPALHRYILQKAFLRLNQVMRVVELVTFASIRVRIALYLREARVRQGMVTLRLTQEQIALEVGTAREVVSRVLGEFVDEGLVALSRGTIQLLDEKVLKNITAE